MATVTRPLAPYISALLTQFGDNGLHYLHLRPDKSLFVSRNGCAYLAFRAVADVAVALGRPMGPQEAWQELLEEFSAYCRQRALRQVFCGLTRKDLMWFAIRGYSGLKIGDEALIDVAGLELRGKHWRECRAALNRAHRWGVQFRWLPPDRRTAQLVQEIEEVSRRWLAAKLLPEMRFGLSQVSSVRDSGTRLAVALRHDTRIEGFVTWVPVPARNAWSLDLMRRRGDSMAGLMDFLIAASLLSFKAEGVTQASLGGTPLSNVGPEVGGVVRRVLDLAFSHISLGYSARRLWHYKQKFNPNWQPMYLAAAPGVSRLRACCAVARACLP